MSQRVTVPSLTDSPSAGIVMTVPPDVAAGAAGAATGGGVGAGAAATGVSITGAGALGAAGVEGAGALASEEIIASSAPTATV